ncbi:MAG: hypothetical protein ACYDHH_31615 [Solirubrobacteraceae bacterium]
MLWRAGLRIQEALALTEPDLDAQRGSVLIRHGKNDKRREVGIRLGVVDAGAVDRGANGDAGRAAVLRDRRPDPRAGVRRASTAGPSSAETCSRCRAAA